jgi:hypothetical protein
MGAFPANMIENLLADIRTQQNETIEEMLGDAIKKGIILVRQSEPMLFMSPDTIGLTFRHSAVIDYKGAEKIEELERDIEYLKKINADLHIALGEFYEKTKVNTWQKR